MPTAYKNIFCIILLLLTLDLHAKTFSVNTEITISNGDWFPLPENDMKAAAVDTALAELTKNGLFSIVTKNQVDKLSLNISLIGPAETAKLTITANLKEHSTYISTASISLHDMYFQDIYNAFEHIGLVAAQRLNDKIEALVTLPKSKLKTNPQSNNKTLQSLFYKAQKLKRQYQYKDSRILFEQVAAAKGKGSKRLSLLSQDELRYGLTVFEAKQSTQDIYNKSPTIIFSLIKKSENLYRQIIAENGDSFQRTQEAHSSLDDLVVNRNMIKNTFNAVTLKKAHNIRTILEFKYMTSGACPNQKKTSQLISSRYSDITLQQVNTTKKETLYLFFDDYTENTFTLSCANMRMTLVD